MLEIINKIKSYFKLKRIYRMNPNHNILLLLIYITQRLIKLEYKDESFFGIFVYHNDKLVKLRNIDLKHFFRMANSLNHLMFLGLVNKSQECKDEIIYTKYYLTFLGEKYTSSGFVEKIDTYEIIDDYNNYLIKYYNI